jgi:hypothetical protein
MRKGVVTQRGSAARRSEAVCRMRFVAAAKRSGRNFAGGGPVRLLSDVAEDAEPMLPRNRKPADPTEDVAAPAVLAAHRAAVAAGKETAECYRAGVEIWRRYHPDHVFAYASAQAVEVILRANVSLRVEA